MGQTPNPLPHYRTAESAFRAGDFDAAAKSYQLALAIEPEFARAHLRFAELLLARKQPAEALAELRAGYRPVGAQVTPYSGNASPKRILQIGSASVKGLTNTDCILDPGEFETTTLIAQYWDPDGALPEHDLAINLIADPDIDAPALAMTAALLERSDAPIINRPERIRATSRTANPTRLQTIPGVLAPNARLLPRIEITQDLAPPFLVRSPGFHNGAHFERIDASGAIAETLATLPGDELLVIDYVDTSAADGRFSKYRAMIVDGVPYPAHLAISNHWNVHYFSAQMGEAERAIEDSYLEDLPKHLGARVTNALIEIGRLLGLDYVGIDFGIAADGKVVVFEANAAMTIVLPELSAQTRSRHEAAQRIFEAAREMLRARIIARRA